jgi:hypothetical protein
MRLVGGCPMANEPVLFDGYDSLAPAAQAERLFQAWRAIPDCRPLLGSTRQETIVKRIEESIEAGFDRETILGALERCWKWSSRRAWQTALDIARRETQAATEPVLSDAQRQLMRISKADGRLSR